MRMEPEMRTTYTENSNSACFIPRVSFTHLLFSAMILLTCIVPRGFAGDTIQIGDTFEHVLEVFDSPQGIVKGGGQTILVYERGMVTLVDGKVVKIEIVSLKELEETREGRERKMAELRKADAIARQKRIADGTAELAARKGDVAFGKLAPAERVAYWKQFKSKYPEVSVNAELQAAESDLAAVSAEKVTAEKERLEKAIAEKEKEEAEVADKLSRSVSGWHLRRNRADLKRIRAELTDLKKELAAL